MASAQCGGQSVDVSFGQVPAPGAGKEIKRLLKPPMADVKEDMEAVLDSRMKDELASVGSSIPDQHLIDTNGQSPL